MPSLAMSFLQTCFEKTMQELQSGIQGEIAIRSIRLFPVPGFLQGFAKKEVLSEQNVCQVGADKIQQALSSMNLNDQMLAQLHLQ